MPKLNKKKPSEGRFNRGFDLFEQQATKNPHTRALMASCFSCKYFYQAEDDDRELCQNTEVLKYDMVVNGNRVFCSFWKGVWEE